MQVRKRLHCCSIHLHEQAVTYFYTAPNARPFSLSVNIIVGYKARVRGHGSAGMHTEICLCHLAYPHELEYIG